MATYKGTPDVAATDDDLAQADINIIQANMTVAQANIEGLGTKDKDQTDVYTTFKDSCSGLRWGTELIVTHAVHSTHPKHHVTGISTNTCDLVGFSKAGHADLTLKTEGDKFLAERIYAAPPNRLEGGIGKMDDKVKYGFYEISFQGQTFEFYTVQWLEKYSTLR